VLPVLLYGCETWTLTKDLRQRLNSFGSRSLRRILGHRCSDFVSNEQLLRETQKRYVPCGVCERQLRLYGHMAHFPDADTAHQILSARESREWRRSMSRPRTSWLQQVDRHLNDGDGPGICLGDGQMEAPGVLAESGRSDVLLWHMLPYLTCPVL